MSKRHHHSKHFDDYDDYDYERNNHEESVRRRKLKRMKNAIRSKDIDDLMNLDEDLY